MRIKLSKSDWEKIGLQMGWMKSAAKSCWKNYRKVGLKRKGGKIVNNCVPK